MSLTCNIIGGTSLARQCCELLLARGWSVTCFISRDPECLTWARERNLTALEVAFPLKEIIPSEPVDYLFSIVNPDIIPDEVIVLAKRAAINYHDSLLPRYAGVNATSWALANQETQHGVTWHTIATQVDTGDLLLQQQIQISNDDTSYTLNLACYEAARILFHELIEQLESGTEQRRPQALEQRSYFGRFRRLPQNGFISWGSSAEEIAARVRASNFGPHTNTFGCVKFPAGDSVYVVTKASTAPDSGQASSTVVRLEDSALGVQTGSGVLIIEELSDIGGERLSCTSFSEKYHLELGSKLANSTLSVESALLSRLREARRSESESVEKLLDFSPLSLFCIKDLKRSSENERPLRKTLTIDAVGLHKEATSTLALFLAYLRRLRREDRGDVVVATASPHDLHFLSKSPLRSSISLDSSLAEVLPLLEAQLNEVLETVSIERDIFVRVPILRSHGAAQQFAAASLCVLPPGFSHETSIRDEPLLVSFSEGGSLSLAYCTERVEGPALEALVERFLLFAEQTEVDLHAKLGEIPLLSRAEDEARIKYACSLKSAGPRSLLELFEHQVTIRGDMLALVCGDEQRTYRQVKEAIHTIAQNLVGCGVNRGDRVVVFTNPSCCLAEIPLGVWACGGVSISIDPTTPVERVEQIIHECRPRLVITDLPLKICTVATVSPASFYRPSEVHDLPEPSLDDPAYMIFTSGSTGVPKGVILSHRNLTCMVEYSSEILPVSPGQTVIAQASVNFDLSVLQMFYPLAVGGKVVVVPQEVREDSRLLKELLEHQSSSFFSTVPSQLESLRSLGWDGRGVAQLLCGGEPLTSGLAAQFAGRDLRVVNAYGPSETTVCATSYTIKEAGEHSFHGVESIGLPVACTDIQIVDERLSPLPPYVPGEVIIGGEAVGLGYDEALASVSARFFSQNYHDKHIRYYRSGDLAFRGCDGSFYFLGRLDHQVKIRGVRIELGEVRAAIATHPNVINEIVVTRVDSQGSKQIVAYVTGTVETDELLTYLQKRLLPQAVPAAIVRIEEFPLLPSGKIALAALPDPSFSGSRAPFIPPRDSTEFQLARIWEELLKCSTVSVLDDFFSLGGHSLLAVTLSSQIREHFNVNVPLAKLGTHSSLESMAALIKECALNKGWSCLVPLTEGTTDLKKVYLIHPFGGTVFCYKDLAAALQPSCNTSGVQAFGLEVEQAPFYTAEAMAERYCKEILAKEGPTRLCLAGFSFGGLIAFEMARQLREAGHKAVDLILLDTAGPGSPAEYSGDDDISFLLDIFSPFCTLPEELIRSAGGRKEQFSLILSLLREKCIIPPDFSLEQADRFLAVYKAHHAIQLSYNPQKLSGSALLIRSANREGSQFRSILHDPLLGWGGRTTEALEVLHLEGINHQEILNKPAVAEVARAILQVLKLREEERYERCA